MIAVLQKAFDVLELLAREPEQPLLLRDVAEALNMNQPTCARILQSLVDAGYAEKYGERKGFILGPMAYFLAEKGPYRKHLTMLAEPIIQRLAERLHEHAILASYHRGRRYVLANANGNPELQVRIDSPYFRDLYTTATGKLLLCYADEKEILAYVDANGYPGERWNGITNRKALLAAAEQVREDGHMIDAGSEHTVKIAFPVNQNGKVIAAVGSTVPKAAFAGDHREHCLREVPAAAIEIEAKLATSPN